MRTIRMSTSCDATPSHLGRIVSHRPQIQCSLGTDELTARCNHVASAQLDAIMLHRPHHPTRTTAVITTHHASAQEPDANELHRPAVHFARALTSATMQLGCISDANHYHQPSAGGATWPTHCQCKCVACSANSMQLSGMVFASVCIGPGRSDRLAALSFILKALQA